MPLTFGRFETIRSAVAVFAAASAMLCDASEKLLRTSSDRAMSDATGPAHTYGARSRSTPNTSPMIERFAPR